MIKYISSWSFSLIFSKTLNFLKNFWAFEFNCSTEHKESPVNSVTETFKAWANFLRTSNDGIGHQCAGPPSTPRYSNTQEKRRQTGTQSAHALSASAVFAANGENCTSLDTQKSSGRSPRTLNPIRELLFSEEILQPARVRGVPESTERLCLDLTHALACHA